jgi:hypothetical protein
MGIRVTAFPAGLAIGESQAEERPAGIRVTKPRFAVNDVIAVVDPRPGCREVPYLQRDSGLPSSSE